jgi:hypothetical protein
VGFFKTVPAVPPPSRVPAVLQRRQVIERELIEFKLQIDEMVLACVEGHPDGRKNLAALLEKIRTAEFEIECLPLARDLAERLDKIAVAAWRAEVQTLNPHEIIAGLTKHDCCDRCTNGCVILGGDATADQNACSHPRHGELDNRYADNPQVQKVFAVAFAKVNPTIFEGAA